MLVGMQSGGGVSTQCVSVSVNKRVHAEVYTVCEGIYHELLLVDVFLRLPCAWREIHNRMKNVE